MSEWEEKYLDAALEEVLGGKTPPDISWTAARRPRRFRWEIVMIAASLLVCGGILWTITHGPQESDLRPTRAQDASPSGDLVQRLGDDDPAVREDAQRKLLDMGEDAVDGLTKARESKDPEVRARAGEILREIGSRVAAKYLKLTVSVEKKAFGSRDAIRAQLKLANTGRVPVVVLAPKPRLGGGLWGRWDAWEDMFACDVWGSVPKAESVLDPGDDVRFAFWPTRAALEHSRKKLIRPPPLVEVAEEDFAVVAPGQTMAIFEDELMTFGSENPRQPGPHVPGAYTVDGRYHFHPEADRHGVALVFKGAAEQLWKTAFRGALKAEPVHFEVK